MSNFSSIIDSVKGLESKIVDKYNFTSSIISNFSFDSIIQNFNGYLNIFKADFISSITIIVDKVKLLLNIKPKFISEYRMEINQSLLSVSNKFNIIFTSVSDIGIVLKQLLLIKNVSFQSVNSMVSILRQILKVNTNSIIYNYTITAVPTCKKYTMLNYYDSYNLSDLDSNLLQDMDYTIV